MSNKSQIERAARDRIIDQLGFGFTYPLTDLDIADAHLKVPVNQAADIPILLSQSDVVYQLHDEDNKEITDDNGNGFKIAGNDSEVLLKTPLISKEVTYKIWARKSLHEHAETLKYATYLQQTAEIKVGLDTTLNAKILDHPLLDSSIVFPANSDARIIHYNQSVTVQVDNTQEGVKYQLFLEKADIQSAVSDEFIGLGSGQPIQISSNTPILEDSILYIRMRKTFSDSETTPDDIDWLDVSLPLKVRPNPDLAVNITPSSIVDFNTQPAVTIDNSQHSARYRIYRHRIADAEFDFKTKDNSKILKVPVQGFQDVPIKKPDRKELWIAPGEGYDLASDWVSGTGNQLSITLAAVEADSLIIVQAEKLHQDKGKTIPSSVQLYQSAVILVRPDPAIALRLRMLLMDTTAFRSIQLSNGQAGVFYHFNLAGNAEEISLPAYFHQWGAEPGELNKGIDQLRLSADFVVTNVTSPQTPVVDFENLPNGANLHIQARKAQTNVTADLNQLIKLPPQSKLKAQPEIVEVSGSAEIQVLNSKTKVDYQLLEDDQAIGEIKKGNGATLKLATGAMTQDTLFTVRSIHHLKGGIDFEIDQAVEVKIKVS